MRIRSTKPEFWRSKTIAALPWDVRLVLKGIESYVDDNGVGKDDIALIAADVFPRDLSANPPETLARLSEAISQLSRGGLVTRYEWEGDDFIYVERWKELQRIDKPTKGRFPRPDGTMNYADPVIRENYRNPREDFGNPPEKVAPGTGEQGNRGTGEKRSSSTASPPTARYSDGFESWWQEYPRRVGKGAAAKAFDKALKMIEAEELSEITARYADSVAGTDERFIPHPATWLNERRWEDPIHAHDIHKRDPKSGLLVER
ncbi:hypothetical protein [uncultured Gordonia sp.]|uniref:hypothetical protein n=1 Tax=uncultured Gordonia sp. TaxID=198437 RepID=UPI0025851ABE|nr:hypothetical protein [uncultured Gordonia sp.]